MPPDPPPDPGDDLAVERGHLGELEIRRVDDLGAAAAGASRAARAARAAT